MSIDLNWDTLTAGPDGEALAERIRSFIHDKFQTVPLPRFIRSVTVHGFDFGTIPPRLDLKDITDPLPDFYDGDLYEDESDEDDDYQQQQQGHGVGAHDRHGLGVVAGGSGAKAAGGSRAAWLRNEAGAMDSGSPFLGASTPGILGGPGLSYFQGHLGTGTQTPLAAVAGAHLSHSWLGSPLESEMGYTPSHSRNPSQSSISVENFNAAAAAVASGLDPGHVLREKSSVSTLAPTSVDTSRPPTRDSRMAAESAIAEEDDEVGIAGQQGLGHGDDDSHRPRREPRIDDVQAVFRIQYSGDIRLNLTAEILLDYPMPSFVGIPLKLNITGLSFDGVGVLAHIRKRLHFCFLSPEDAMTAVGPDEQEPPNEEQSTNANGGPSEQSTGRGESQHQHKARFGGLLQEIKVESEIGERDGGKQSLKNVGKVERFVLEQVRRIFEEEFVYPSFWTFLV